MFRNVPCVSYGGGIHSSRLRSNSRTEISSPFIHTGAAFHSVESRIFLLYRECAQNWKNHHLLTLMSYQTLWDFLSSVEYKRIYFEKCLISDPMFFCFLFGPNGFHFIKTVEIFLKIFVCVLQKKASPTGLEQN